MSTDKKALDSLAFNDRVSLLITELDNAVSINNETNEVEVKDFDKLYIKHLPEDVTEEIVKSISDYRQDMSVATAYAVGGRITRHAISNPDVGNLEVRMSSPDVDFGVGYSKPTVKKPTRKHYQKATTSYTGVRKSPIELEVLDALADLWE